MPEKNKQFFYLAANCSMLVTTVLFLETPTQLQIINLRSQTTGEQGCSRSSSLVFYATNSVNYLLGIQLK